MYIILAPLLFILLPHDYGITPGRAMENVRTAAKHFEANKAKAMPAGWFEDALWCESSWTYFHFMILPKTNPAVRLMWADTLVKSIGREAFEAKLMPPPTPVWHLGGIQPLSPLVPPSRAKK